jgi:hypothetical protein
MSKAKPKNKAPQRERTPLLTAIFILIMAHGALLAAAAYYDLTTSGIEVKSLYMPVLLLTSIADVIAGIAMWKWKWWGFQLYVASALVGATAAVMNTGALVVIMASLLPMAVAAYFIVPKQKLFE